MPVGALNGAFRNNQDPGDDQPGPAAGTLPIPPTPPPQQPGYGTYIAANDPSAINDPYVDASIANGAGGYGSSYADQQAQFASELRGQSPLGQFQALSRARDAAANQKAAAITRAMSILQAAQGNQSTNLPMLAAAAAIGAPTRTGTFSEALSRGFGAAVPAIEQQREQQWRQDQELANLGIAAGSVPLETSQADLSDFWNRMKLAEQAGQGAALVGGKSDVANINAGAKRDVATTNAGARAEAARIAAGGRIAWAQINADRNRWQYLGPDPSNPNQGWYLDKAGGSVNPGPAVSPKQSLGSDPARIKEANALVTKGIAPDFGTAYSMVRFGVSDAKSAADFTREVQAEKRGIQQTPQGMAMSDAQLENMARQNILKRNAFHEKQGDQQNAQDKGQAQTPAQAAPAPAPATQTPTQAAPSNAAPLPWISQGGKQVIDHTKLKDGQVYDIPGRGPAVYDEKNATFNSV